MESTTKNFGNELQGWTMQPDYRMTHNGYGLLQLTATFAADGAFAGQSTTYFKRGDFLPDASRAAFQSLGEQTWTCIKADESGKDLDHVFVTGQYAAIDKDVNGGIITETEATINASAVSEPITSHPNFTKRQLPQLGGTKPLGGVPPVSKLNPGVLGDEINNPYRAKWIPSQTGQVASYQFVDFLPAQRLEDPINIKAGIKSYFRPSITMRLTGYTTSAVAAVDTVKYVWWSTTTGVGILTIPDIYKGILNDNLVIESDDPQIKKGKNWLITGSNMEVYGGLYKVTADLMLSGIAGWDRDIYPKLTQTVAI